MRSMTRKNWALAIILVVLTGVLGIMLSSKRTATNMQVNKTLFAVADTAAIDKIVLRQPDGLVQTLNRRNGYWQLNDNHAVDPAIMQLMLSALSQVQVKRPVARNQQEEVLDQLSSQGVEVELNDSPANRFVAGGRAEDAISYFARDDQAYVVELPGYSSFISGIFYLKEGDMRNKMLTTLNSMNFQGLDVVYPADSVQNVSIRFQDNMLGAVGIERPDSTVLFQYMMIYEPLQIAGYLTPGEDPGYDSLLQTAPQAIFSMHTVGNTEGLRLQLYPPLPGRPYRLGYLPKQKEAVLIDERLAQAMLIRREDLMLRE